jgi:hypothetical protein
MTESQECSVTRNHNNVATTPAEKEGVDRTGSRRKYNVPLLKIHCPTHSRSRRFLVCCPYDISRSQGCDSGKAQVMVKNAIRMRRPFCLRSSTERIHKNAHHCREVDSVIPSDQPCYATENEKSMPVTVPEGDQINEERCQGSWR